MEVSMKRSGIACCERIFEYSQPVEQAVETVVPDTMPDVERVLCADGEIIIQGKDVHDGKMGLTAGVAATVLYSPEGGGEVCTLGVALPIEVTLDAPGVTQESLPVAMLSVTSVEARMLNPRKLLVRAVVAVNAECYVHTQLDICDGIEGDGARSVEAMSEGCTVSPVVCVREKTFVVSDEYRLQAGQPALGDILWHGVDIIAGSTRSVGSRLVFGGTVRLQLLYRAAETGELCSACFETEFSQMLETDTELTSPDCSVYSMLTAKYVEPGTLSGGERGVTAEFHLVSQAVCTDSVRISCVTDCYSNSCKLETERRELELGCVQRRSTVRSAVHESLPATPSAEAVCRVMCRTGTASCEGGTLRCPVTVTVMYSASDGNAYSVSRRLTAEASAELGENEYAALVRASCAEASAAPTAGGLDVRLLIDFELLAVRRLSISQIKSISCGEALDNSELPSVTVIRVSKGQSLWQLGKKYHSTAKLIAAQNALEDSECPEGRILIIPTART